MADEVVEETYEVIEEVDNNEEQDIYECSTCNMSFSDVHQHLREFHPDEKQDEEESQHEDESSEVEGLAFVVKNPDGKYECVRCSRTYKTCKRYLDHIKAVHPKEESTQELGDCLVKNDKNEDICEVVQSDGNSNFRCKVCNTTFSSRKKILLHYPIHLNVAAAKRKHQKKFPASSVQTFYCKLCNRSMDTAIDMKMHMNAHDENLAQGSKLKEAENKVPPKKAKAGDEKGAYACQYCKKEFKRPHEKVKHERIHTGEKPYSCDICGKQFRVTYCLSLHKRNVHSEERPYICIVEFCNKRFKSQSVYNHHLNTHGTAKNYKCPFCEKAFKTSVQLAGHKNTHTKPFPCEICSRAFASLYAVKAHLKNHRKDSLNLKYTCGLCSAQYGRSFALNDHMKAAHPGSLSHETECEMFVVGEEMPESEEVYSVVIEDGEESSNV